MAISLEKKYPFDNYKESNYITENYYTINNTNKLTELQTELNLYDKISLDSDKEDNWFKKDLKKRKKKQKKNLFSKVKTKI